jgi:hypothetical protein
MGMGIVFGGTDTRVDAAVDVYEDAPPGGAAGSIARHFGAARAA